MITSFLKNVNIFLSLLLCRRADDSIESLRASCDGPTTSFARPRDYSRNHAPKRAIVRSRPDLAEIAQGFSARRSAESLEHQAREIPPDCVSLDLRKSLGVLPKRSRNLRLKCAESENPHSMAIAANDLLVFSTRWRASDNRISMNAARGEFPSAFSKCRSRRRFVMPKCFAIWRTERGASRLC